MTFEEFCKEAIQDMLNKEGWPLNDRIGTLQDAKREMLEKYPDVDTITFDKLVEQLQTKVEILKGFRERALHLLSQPVPPRPRLIK